MRTILRSIRSGEYLESFETWTSMAGNALDFQSIPRALELVRRRGLKDMELVIEEDPAQTTTVPIEKLHLISILDEGESVKTQPKARKAKESAAREVAPAPAKRPGRQKPRKARAARARRKPRPVLAKT